MTNSLRSYAKIGLVHHMLYPEITNDPHLHLTTLEAFLQRKDIDTAIRKCGSLIERVHLGNCVLRDPSSIWYGDMHPPMTLESREIGLAECQTALKALYEIGYLNKEQPKPLILEMRPIDGIEKTVSASIALAEAAWAGLEV